MAWQQDITEKLQELQSIAVRFDVEQELTSAEQATARANIAVGATAVNTDGEDYNIKFN